ncbi:hypothetical protein MTBBW1_1670094 [Desulfamplus magnetovallimortis]|uniref:phosphoglycerate mutase (2,3-diphosphoglycerate-independent) n=1 Tax=Desulfamplus magnetovallimortis TaxID=1246637 RepID=A0A1W1H9N6_9BACT|nr:hypothetical protein MTBBW1_1670094 [Desulfamplus magnetovallimortis]
MTNDNRDQKRNCDHRVDALVILDGWGKNPFTDDNAVAMSGTPFLKMLELSYPSSELLCSGNAVGLPDGIMGNSEVGHMNIGAGRKVFQDLVRINNAISDRSFLSIPSLVNTMQTLKNEGNALHLMGLLSDGGVHSHITHLFSLIDMACDFGIDNIYIHAILDGRDTPPKSGFGYLEQLQSFLKKKVKVKLPPSAAGFMPWTEIQDGKELRLRTIFTHGDRKKQQMIHLKPSMQHMKQEKPMSL